MSGSNGGDYMPPKSNKFDCETSVVETAVSSVDLDVLRKHKVGDRLNVIINEKRALILEDGDGEILGSILHIYTSDIINCISSGKTYEAKITKINHIVCHVSIKSK